MEISLWSFWLFMNSPNSFDFVFSFHFILTLDEWTKQNKRAQCVSAEFSQVDLCLLSIYLLLINQCVTYWSHSNVSVISLKTWFLTKLSNQWAPCQSCDFMFVLRLKDDNRLFLWPLSISRVCVISLDWKLRNRYKSSFYLTFRKSKSQTIKLTSHF